MNQAESKELLPSEEMVFSNDYIILKATMKSEIRYFLLSSEQELNELLNSEMILDRKLLAVTPVYKRYLINKKSFLSKEKIIETTKDEFIKHNGKKEVFYTLSTKTEYIQPYWIEKFSIIRTHNCYPTLNECKGVFRHHIIYDNQSDIEA